MNDNKSTVMNNAAVQQLRKVPGFDPMKLLRKTISVKTGIRSGSWISAISGLVPFGLPERENAPEAAAHQRPAGNYRSAGLFQQGRSGSGRPALPPNSAGRMSPVGNFSVPHRRTRSTWHWKTPASVSSSAT